MCVMTGKESIGFTRIVELLEEQNELTRENNQLLGDVLNSLDNLGTRATIGSNDGLIPPPPNAKTSNDPAPKPDSAMLELAIYGLDVVPVLELATLYETSHFWPKPNKSPHGWVRVSIKHPSEESLQKRVDRGCLCGKPIVPKEHNGDFFLTCEALSQKGSCPYRPAAYFDKLTFLTNLPPAK